MTNALSSMGYPHWLIAAGTVLLVFGFIGMALRLRVAPAELEEMAIGDEQGWPEAAAEPAQTQAANRKARLEEQKRDRWADILGRHPVQADIPPSSRTSSRSRCADL